MQDYKIDLNALPSDSLQENFIIFNSARNILTRHVMLFLPKNTLEKNITPSWLAESRAAWTGAGNVHVTIV